LGILQRLFKWAKTKVVRCPRCNKWIPVHKMQKHKAECKKKRRREKAKAKREERERRRRRH
jgi:hypothetical protein